ncbi:MAG: F0F1 ATP synthase subunit epsilon [Jatrophihabitantaceae bacterium]
MSTMNVELVSVERRLWAGEATAVFARTIEGELGILPGHTPLLGALAPGWVVRIQREGEPEMTVAVHGGFLSVRKDGVSVLAEMAELAEDIDVARAREALTRTASETEPDAVAAHNRALSRLRAAGEAV